MPALRCLPLVGCNDGSHKAVRENGQSVASRAQNTIFERIRHALAQGDGTPHVAATCPSDEELVSSVLSVPLTVYYRRYSLTNPLLNAVSRSY